jgi:hypothetical protein
MCSQSSSTADLRDTLNSSRYMASVLPQEKTSLPINSSVLIKEFLPRHCIETVVLPLLCVHFRGNLFNKSLPKNERLLWLRCSRFQAYYHSIKSGIVLCLDFYKIQFSIVPYWGNNLRDTNREK